jgi:putative membrane protein
MDLFLQQLLNTIILRPYVFIFLAVYLLGCTLHLGIKRALTFCASGYVITWLSEFSSIHTGIPYGFYYYVESTKGYELWLLGVPFMDSLSYVFLAYASYSMALFTVSPVFMCRNMIYLLETRKLRQSLFVTMLSAIYFVYLDIIIDPLALRGSRWFLGQIYGYPEAGAYFGVTIANFAGWVVVGFILTFLLQCIDNMLSRKGIADWTGHKCRWRYLIGPVLYAGILAFNIFMTFYIGENNIGWVGLFIMIMPAFLVWTITRIKMSIVSQDAIALHLKDFPEAEICMAEKNR